MKTNFKELIAELANITNYSERKARAYSIECKLQASVYRSEISIKEYSELIEVLSVSVGGKEVG